MRKTIKPEDVTAVIDTREQWPFDLAPMPSEPGTLYTGDYSVRGLECIVAIERKSLPDLVACCGRERERFERELQRLKSYPVSALIVESTWADIEAGQWQGRMSANAVLQSLASWIAQGHRVIVAPRDMSERICRSILFHAARHRWREACQFNGLVAKQQERKRKRDSATANADD